MDSPGRVPDWRWKRAVNVRENQDVPVTRHRDGCEGHRWIREADRFRQAYARCRTIGEFRMLQEEQLFMYSAHQFYCDNRDTQRYSLEANLLTDRSFLEIAHKCRLPVETVTAYEAVFYNVRDSLENPHYIVNSVICPSVETGVAKREFDYLWKLYAYFMGGPALDAVQTLFADPHKVRTSNNVDGAMRDDVISTSTLQASLAAKTIGKSERTKLELLTLFAKFVEIARDAANVGKAQDSILSSIQSMLDDLPLEIGRKAFTSSNPSLEYDKSSVELNIAEMTHLSTYGELPGKNELLEMTFDTVLTHNRNLNLHS